ncbi:tRNA (uridine(34)/cytosine(34)/5-carboxymethylaminomethyluridine(34)-2'-O)-methyltransferase TrmL [Holzapfeliella sp. He02]|uniref:Putative tRNA (cytidine(34)-2'-O)-methyltransferase n=1 Tax=Holzapfeliella saturejae TaxID=3082953 RepID=A0ABU8SFM3_9LACO
MTQNHIVLYEPLIPANTGNIARTAAGTKTSLHLIEPLGFKTDDKHLKRAGLDYWNDVDIHYHKNLEAFMQTLGENDELFLITKFSSKTYADVSYQDPNKNYYFMFGKETTGLPEDFMKDHEEKALRIPMTDKIRALNLSNTAAIIIYEALRQQNFLDLKRELHYKHDKLKD